MNRDFALLPQGCRVLCAVSGGADSMCLLHWLCSQGDLQVIAAHYEHGLRGEESLRDAAFVEDFCKENGIPCVVEHGDAGAYARKKHLGIEEAARELRYAFLERTADEHCCDRIATAHNADDQTETVLLNLCRGAGLSGLCGIPPKRGRIVRPLLQTTRREIEDYLLANALSHIEDSSNRDESFRRNRLRHQVLPILRELNPRLSETLARSSALLREDAEYLEEQAERFLQEHAIGDGLPLQELLALHRAISSRVLRHVCPQMLEQKHVEAALTFCAGEGLGYLNLPGLRLRREQGRLYFSGESVRILPERIVRAGEILELPEIGLRFRVDQIVYQGEVYDLFKTFLFKCEHICGTLICTGRRPGDSFHPQGRNCGKSLHDLFRETGLTQQERERIPVFRDERGVLAVLGYPADERVKPQIGDLVLRVQIIETGGRDGASD